MTKDLKQKLKDHWDGFTASERKIATYLMHNIRDLPFETAASLGKRVAVSPMTVGRFLRTLGYEGLGELKEEFRGDGTWRHFYKPPELPQDGDPIATHLLAETRALAGVHEVARTKEWKAVIKLLVAADRVSVASFSTRASSAWDLPTCCSRCARAWPSTTAPTTPASTCCWIRPGRAAWC